MSYHAELARHYERSWGASTVWRLHGSRERIDPEFHVLEHAREGLRTYATCGMSVPGKGPSIELHLHSRVATNLHVELLTVVAWFHRTTPLGLHHTVNFGRPWLPGSPCDYGLISLPYPEGPKVERFEHAACYWLLPITRGERDFKKQHGIEALEQKFEQCRLDYLRADRASVV